MSLLRLNVNPSGKQLRWFAALWFPAFCALLGAFILRNFHLLTAARCIWVLGAGLSIAGVFVTQLIRPVYIGMMTLTYPIGWTVSHVLLLVVYGLAITPIGFLVRLFHDPMARHFDKSTESYWQPREDAGEERYFRQL